MKKLFKRIKNNKLLRYTGVGIIFLLLLLVGRVTYAYFAADINAAQGNVVAGNDTVDAIKFEVGDPLSLNVNSNTLPENGTNLVTNTTTKARLLANSTTNEATYTYYVYLNLTDNTFVYTKENTPEIILSVVDPNGNEVTDISGLTYGTFNGVTGFDVTTYEGMILLSQFTITSSSSTEETIQEWSITLTYLNQPYDQTVNFGHSLKTDVRMQKEEYRELFSDYIIGLYTTQGANNLYHHDGTLENGINDGSYRYAGSYETTQNWVCFGTDDETCDDEHLYRIIGIFENQVKLIKAYEGTEASLGTAPHGDGYKEVSYYKGKLDPTPGYSWVGSSSNYNNDWTQSLFNTQILNGTYLMKIGDNWANKIATAEWKIGGFDSNNANPNFIYQSEIINSSSNKITTKKVGLMYVSDYGFAASPENWTKALYVGYQSDTNRGNNWLFMGIYEWTLSPKASTSNSSFSVNHIGGGTNNTTVGKYGVRPTFYLNSNVTFAGGSGTETDPYRIA